MFFVPGCQLEGIGIDIQWPPQNKKSSFTYVAFTAVTLTLKNMHEIFLYVFTKENYSGRRLTGELYYALNFGLKVKDRFSFKFFFMLTMK